MSVLCGSVRLGRLAGVVLAAAALLAASGAIADDALLPSVSAVPRNLDLDWQQGLRLEDGGQYREAGQVYERILAREPGRFEAAWRAARSFWLVGEQVSLGTFDAREPWFERADEIAGAGLAANPRCGECALWKYAAMGRLVEHRGSLWAARHASELRDLLELGIAARPSHRDPDGNSALGNLYYSGAIFYRMVPEWFWLPLIVGVKGDTGRALDYIQQALAISRDRIDYQIEHGAVLLCRAEREADEVSAEAGVRVLERAVALPPKQPSDAIDQHYARLLIEDSSEACGFTRRGFLDVEAMGRDARRGL